MPSLESFDSKHMSRAWRVCWGTTTLILLFLLFLWFYFAFYFENKTEDQLWNLRSTIKFKNAQLTIWKVNNLLSCFMDLSLCYTFRYKDMFQITKTVCAKTLLLLIYIYMKLYHLMLMVASSIEQNKQTCCPCMKAPNTTLVYLKKTYYNGYSVHHLHYLDLHMNKRTWLIYHPFKF